MKGIVGECERDSGDFAAERDALIVLMLYACVNLICVFMLCVWDIGFDSCLLPFLFPFQSLPAGRGRRAAVPTRSAGICV